MRNLIQEAETRPAQRRTSSEVRRTLELLDSLPQSQDQHQEARPA